MMKRRVLAVFMALALVVTAFPLGVASAGEAELSEAAETAAELSEAAEAAEEEASADVQFELSESTEEQLAADEELPEQEAEIAAAELEEAREALEEAEEQLGEAEESAEPEEGLKEENPAAEELEADDAEGHDAVETEEPKAAEESEAAAEPAEQPEEEALSLDVMAAGVSPKFTVGNVIAIPGESVELSVSLKDNPGIAGVTLILTYDDTLLTLTDAKSGDAFSGALDLITPGRLVSGAKFQWFATDISEEQIKDGTALILTFEVAENAGLRTKIPVAVTAERNSIRDREVKVLKAEIENGSVTVLDFKPGDLDEDGKVTARDVILMGRHIVGGYDISIKEEAADVDDDGMVGTADLILTRRYIVGGYGVELIPSSPKCEHELEEVERLEPTCRDGGREGHIAYWHCTICGKYFEDAEGQYEILLEDTILPATEHVIVVDPAVPATTESTGLTEGAHCSVCNEVIIPQEETVPLESHQHSISYDIANGESYIEGLLSTDSIKNENSDRYEEESGLTLKNLSVAGYRFLGWYDGAGDNAARVQKIEAGNTDDIELYAHWEAIKYEVQFKSSLFGDEGTATYTVDKGLALPTPKLSNYVFAGWSDEDGKLYSGSRIPAGTTGNIALTGNWTSERNKTYTKPKLDEPVIYEDEENDVILFAYEIGEIQNVPLYTIKDFGYISEGGVTKSEQTTYSMEIAKSDMESFATVVAESTTESSDWTLSTDWNETTSQNESWMIENGYTTEQVDTLAKSNSSNWNISSGTSGSTSKTTTDTSQNGWKNEVKINSSKETNDTHKETDKRNWNLNAEISYTPKSYSVGIGDLSASTGGGLGGSISGGYGHEWGTEDVHSETSKLGVEIGGTKEHSELHTDTTVGTASWNSSASYGGSSSVSQSRSVSEAFSEKISKSFGISSSYAVGGGESSSQGLSSSKSSSDEYSSSVTYTEKKSESVTSSWTTQSTRAGYHRWVVAGTAHVFGVVGYNMSTKAYFVYTYSIMDDETHEFEDFSYVSAKFDDNENGVIPFDIPYGVAEYVAERTAFSDGLKVNQTTGVITEYSGTDDCVVIPEYMNVGGGKVVKVTGISEKAFKGNTDIAAVVLSDFVTEIPDNAFKGCTNLIGVSGGNISSIGNEAFSGCTSIEAVAISNKVSSLGSKAFDGAERIFVNAANADVVEAAAASGAKKIDIYLNNLEGGPDSLSGRTVNVPDTAEWIVFDGYGKTYRNLNIASDAQKTFILDMNLEGGGKIPLRISSPEIEFNQVSVNATGIAAVLSAENANIGLQGTVKFSSKGENTLLCKSIDMYEINPRVNGLMEINGKLLICGEIGSMALMTFDSLSRIDESTFNRLLSSYTLYFDANGGSVGEASREVPSGTAIGALPTPTRAQYDFVGWFMEDGIAVTADTSFSSGSDQTVYAKWTAKGYTVSWSAGTGATISVVRESSPNAGASLGLLSNKQAIYYGDVLSVVYSAQTGYSLVTKGKTSISVSGNVTSSDIYATATVNSYTYNIVYKSSNGTSLGSGTVTNKYGTTNTISAPAKTGYTTPSSQSIKWDSVSAKTITFIYYPSPVSTSKTVSGWWWDNGSKGISYSATMSFSNRTASSVTVTISWTNTISAYHYYGFWQAFNCTVGGYSSGTIRICENSTWISQVSYARSSTKSATFTVYGLSATQTSCSYSLATSSYGSSTNPGTISGTCTIPAY